MSPGIITDVEKYKKGWTGGLPETPCGFGSRLAETVIQRKVLPAWARKYGVSSVVDVGAGDLNWVNAVCWDVEYTPLDLVPRHESVQKFDLIHQIPPAGDMVMCLWVLNHLPEEHAFAALENLLRAECKCLVYTWWPAMADFLDLGADESVVIRGRIGAELRLVKC